MRNPPRMRARPREVRHTGNTFAGGFSCDMGGKLDLCCPYSPRSPDRGSPTHNAVSLTHCVTGWRGRTIDHPLQIDERLLDDRLLSLGKRIGGVGDIAMLRVVALTEHKPQRLRHHGLFRGRAERQAMCRQVIGDNRKHLSTHPRLPFYYTAYAPLRGEICLYIH